jgi:hypothetical protein
VLQFNNVLLVLFYCFVYGCSGPGRLVGSNLLRAGRSGDRIPVGARFSAPVQTGPGAHPASCTMGTVSFLGVKWDRDVTLTTHFLLVPWSRKGRAIPLLLLWAVRPVQNLSDCTMVHFTFYVWLCVFYTLFNSESCVFLLTSMLCSVYSLPDGILQLS